MAWPGFSWPDEAAGSDRREAIRIHRIGPDPIEADVTKLRQNLLNLLLGGEITVSRRAAAVEPSSAIIGLLAMGLAVRGEPGALQCARRSAELDPLSPLILGWVAVTAWYCNAVDEAVRSVDAGLRVAPDSPWIHWCGGYVLAAAGKRARKGW